MFILRGNAILQEFCANQLHNYDGIIAVTDVVRQILVGLPVILPVVVVNQILELVFPVGRCSIVTSFKTPLPEKLRSSDSMINSIFGFASA